MCPKLSALHVFVKLIGRNVTGGCELLILVELPVPCGALPEQRVANVVGCRWGPSTGHKSVGGDAGMLNCFALHVRFDAVRASAMLGVFGIRPRRCSMRENPYCSAEQECGDREDQNVECEEGKIHLPYHNGAGTPVFKQRPHSCPYSW